MVHWISLEINLFCILILGRIAYQLFIDRQTKEQWRYFSNAVISAIVYLLMDVIWLLSVNHLVSFTRFQSGLINTVYFFAFSMIMVALYFFGQATLESNIFKSKKQLFFSLIPMIFFIIVVCTTYWTGLIFYIDKSGNYFRGKYLGLFYCIPAFYAIYIALKAKKLSMKTKYYIHQKEYKVLSRFVFLPLLTGIIQVLFPDLLIFNFGMTYALFDVYIYYQQQLISLDPMTQINNRQQLDYYLTNKMKGIRTKKLYLFLLDIDDFKKINDQYGHVVGDQIILKTVDILKEVANHFNCFLSRYGGDEFILICEIEKDENINNLFNYLQKSLDYQDEKLPHFSVSIGYAQYDSSLKYIPDFIHKADQYMYENKSFKK